MQRVKVQLKDLGYDQDTYLKQWELNKALDHIISSDGTKRVFDRDIAEEIWDQTDQNQQRKVNVYDYLAKMVEKNRFEQLAKFNQFFHSKIIQAGETEQQDIENWQKQGKKQNPTTQINPQSFKKKKPTKNDKPINKPSPAPAANHKESLSRPLNATQVGSIVSNPPQRFQYTSVAASEEAGLGNKESLLTEKQKRQSRQSFAKLSKAGKKQSIKKLIKKWYFPPLVVFVIGFAIFILTFIIHSIIVSGAIDQVILSSQNQNVWAHFPGDTKTDIYRNWTFFNITNADEMLFYNQRPKFREIQGFSILEREDFLNITYTDSGDRVDFIDWLHFEQEPSSRDLDQKVKVLNIGGLGYWYNLKITKKTMILQQGMSFLFNTIQDKIVPTIYAQGIMSQFFTDFQAANSQVFSPAEIPIKLAQFIWDDEAYGMSNQDRLYHWFDAIPTNQQMQNQTVGPMYTFLKNYFTLTDNQMGIIIEKMRGYIKFLRESVLENVYFQDKNDETERYLAYRQMTDSFVTRNPPDGTPVTPSESVCQNNLTCAGTYPELDAFYKNVYLKRHPEANKSLTFDAQRMKSWVNYNKTLKPNDPYNFAQDCLFHIGNLDALWANGTEFDKITSSLKMTSANIWYELQPSKKQIERVPNPFPQKQLQNIRVRFGLETLQQTMVFWQWIKYMTYQVILQGQSNEQLGIANLFASGLYQSFTFLSDNLQPFLTTKLVYKDVHQLQTDCISFIKSSMQLKKQAKAESVCDIYGDKITEKLISHLIQICDNTYRNVWINFKSFHSFNALDMLHLCDPEHQSTDSFGYLYHKRREYLDELYKCQTTPKKYCSNFELAAIQWTSSNVTLNPPVQLDFLKSGLTFNEWNSKADKFQYKFYTSKFQKTVFPPIQKEDAFKWLNFDNWFSSSVALRLYISDDFSELYKKYMKYVGIVSGLNGLTMERSPRDMIFGYEDEILKSVKQMYPPFGGDPSTPALVAFNEPNLKEKEATLKIQWNTGKNDYKLIGQYRKINGKPYITIPQDAFNGNQTWQQLSQPWEERDYMYGTAAKFFSPNQFDTQNLSLYIPNLQRYGSSSLNSTFDYERFDFDLLIAYLGDQIMKSTEESDVNKKYYQTFRAIFNETSVYRLPLFVTKNHFMNCTQNWTKLVEIYNQDESIKYEKTSHWDDSFVIIETNYHHVPDQLLDFYEESLLPIFSLWRSGNMTEQVVNDLLSPLKVGLAANIWIRVISIGIVAVAIAFFGYVFYKQKKSQKAQRSSSSLNQSVITPSSGSGIMLKTIHNDDPGVAAADNKIQQNQQQQTQMKRDNQSDQTD